jgi:hypothetical protein
LQKQGLIGSIILKTGTKEKNCLMLKQILKVDGENLAMMKLLQEIKQV